MKGKVHFLISKCRYTVYGLDLPCLILLVPLQQDDCGFKSRNRRNTISTEHMSYEKHSLASLVSLADYLKELHQMCSVDFSLRQFQD